MLGPVPWHEYMKLGMGAMGIVPSEFWNMTFHEFWAIFEVKFPPEKRKPTRKEFEKLFKLDEMRSKRRGRN